MSSIDFNSSSFWSNVDSGALYDGGGDAGFSKTSFDLSADTLAPGTGHDDNSPPLSTGSLGFKGVSDFFDYRGPVRSTIYNANTKEVGGWLGSLGTVMGVTGTGLLPTPWAPVGEGLILAGRGTSAVGGFLTRNPLSLTYLKTETPPDAQGISELRSTYVGVGFGDGGSPTGFVKGDGMSFNGGGPDLNEDGHRDGAYGLVVRGLFPLSAVTSGPLRAGGISANYYAPLDEGFSGTLYATGAVTGGGWADILKPSFKMEAKPVSWQVGLRWPTDSKDFGNLVDHYSDMGKSVLNNIGDVLNLTQEPHRIEDADSWIITDSMKSP